MDVWPAIDAERRAFVAYLRTLPEEAWTQPSLVAGWTVRQVVAHLIALSEITLGSFLAGMIANGLSLNRLNDAGVHRLAAACSNAQLIDRLEARVPARTHPPGPVMTLLGEVVVHGEDIHRCRHRPEARAAHPRLRVAGIFVRCSSGHRAPRSAGRLGPFNRSVRGRARGRL